MILWAQIKQIKVLNRLCQHAEKGAGAPTKLRIVFAIDWQFSYFQTLQSQ